MTLDASRFEIQAAATLDAIAEALEAAGIDAVDAELQGGVLTIEVEGKGSYVLNKHGPSRQLWLSSPLSGASYWAFDPAAGRWTSVRGEGELAEVLAGEIARLTGQRPALG